MKVLRKLTDQKVRQRARKCSRGALVVEFALVLTLIIIPLTVAAIELGAFMWEVQMLSDATRQGARVGVEESQNIAAGCAVRVAARAAAASNAYRVQFNQNTGWRNWAIGTAINPSPTSAPASNMLTVSATLGAGNCIMCFNNLFTVVNPTVSTTYILSPGC